MGLLGDNTAFDRAFAQQTSQSIDAAGDTDARQTIRESKEGVRREVGETLAEFDALLRRSLSFPDTHSSGYWLEAVGGSRNSPFTRGAQTRRIINETAMLRVAEGHVSSWRHLVGETLRGAADNLLSRIESIWTRGLLAPNDPRPDRVDWIVYRVGHRDEMLVAPSQRKYGHVIAAVAATRTDNGIEVGIEVDFDGAIAGRASDIFGAAERCLISRRHLSRRESPRPY